MDLNISHLNIGYGRKTVQTDLNATVCSGQLTCLIGSNGIGKSTLLRTLCGYQKPLSGHVFIGQQPLESLSSDERARLVSIVLPKRPEVPRLSVWEMVALGRTPMTGLMGIMHDQDRKAVKWAMEATGTAALSQRMIGSLSDGECQKVMVAKALAQDTPVILLDEPTAFLDYYSRRQLMILLARLAREMDKTILLSSHDLGLASRLADRLLKLSENGISEESKEQLRDELKIDV